MDKPKVLRLLTEQAKMSAEDCRKDYRSQAVKIINEQDAEIAELKSNQADLQAQIDILRPSKSEKPGTEVVRDIMYRFACFVNYPDLKGGACRECSISQVDQGKR